MGEIYKITDGTSSIDISPIRGQNEPESRGRQILRTKDGLEDAHEWGGKEVYEAPFNNVTKAEADLLIDWWLNMTTLTFTPNLQGIFADLNGTNEFFFRNDADFDESGITSDLTIQGWINLDVLSGQQTIAAKWDSTGNNRSYRFFVTSTGELTFRVSADGTAAVSVTTSGVGLLAGRWYHIAVTYDASAGTADFYKNGFFVEQESGLPNSIADKTSRFIVGGTEANGLTDNLDGGIFNVALFDDQRTAVEILASASDRTEDLSTAGNIIAQWRFNDDAADTFIDNSQGDAGRDLIPHIGGTGDVTFGVIGRSIIMHEVKIAEMTRPMQMWGGDWDTLFAGLLTLYEISSVSFSSSSQSVSPSISCSSLSDSSSCSTGSSLSCSVFLTSVSGSTSCGFDVGNVSVSSCETLPKSSCLDSVSISGSGSVTIRSCSSSKSRSCSDSISRSSSSSCGRIGVSFTSQSCSEDASDVSCSLSAGGQSCSLSGAG